MCANKPNQMSVVFKSSTKPSPHGFTTLLWQKIQEPLAYNNYALEELSQELLLINAIHYALIVLHVNTWHLQFDMSVSGVNVLSYPLVISAYYQGENVKSLGNAV